MTLTERDIRWLKSPNKVKVVSHLDFYEAPALRTALCKCEKPQGDFISGCARCGKRVAA